MLRLERHEAVAGSKASQRPASFGYQSLYCASKFGLEGMMESLRIEVRPFGIRVVLIEPGNTKTAITQNRTVTVDTATRDAYRSFPAALKRTATEEQNGPGPEGVARMVYEIVNTPNPRPNAALEYGMRKYYGVES